MLFNSIDFLLFFPLVVLIYFIIPNKLRRTWLLIASYYFYMSWNVKYGFLLMLSTLLTYLCGLAIEKAQSATVKKLSIFLCFTANLGILFFFKYFNFAMSLAGQVMASLHISIATPYFDVLLPVGISFYTFQALGYTIDVYKGEVPAEKNIIKYALFVSFFPQLVAGPIERSKRLLGQLEKPRSFNYDNMREGLLLMIWGLFLKMVIADRIAMFVDIVYQGYESLTGWYVIVATVFFAVQIYCDFYGYTVIAIGAAKVLGIELMNNFNAPYLSLSVKEFWKNWHISLTSWFRDYLYIPLGGSRRGNVIKYRNILIVFLLSGLWHGASLTFVVWGLINGLYQVIGELLMKVRIKITGALHINEDAGVMKFIRGMVTFILVDFAWIFFRAPSLKDATGIIKSMFRAGNIIELFNGNIAAFIINKAEFYLAIVCIGILLLADVCKKKNISIINWIMDRKIWVRWLIFSVSVIFILVFGKYGPSYDAKNFIYFQF